MISPEEKIYSPRSKKLSGFAEDNVPKQFAHVKPKQLGPILLFLKKILIGCAFVLIIIVGMAIALYGDLSKSNSLFFSMPNPFCKTVKTYLILSRVSRVICQKS